MRLPVTKWYCIEKAERIEVAVEEEAIPSAYPTLCHKGYGHLRKLLLSETFCQTPNVADFFRNFRHSEYNSVVNFVGPSQVDDTELVTTSFARRASCNFAMSHLLS